MEPHIGRWHCRYRIVAAQPEARTAVGLLERDVRGRALDAYAAALEESSRDDPTVYVIRSAHLSMALHVDEAVNEAAMARRWGRLLSAEIVRTLSTQANDGSNVARFCDEADYIAHFLADLTCDRLWHRWCYGAFSRYRYASKSEVVLSVLLENKTLLADIFRYLRSLSSLHSVLTLLDSNASARLWHEAVAPAGRQPHMDEFRVFVRAAVGILKAFEYITDEPEDEVQLLAAYMAARPKAPEWADRRSLAFTVMDVVRFAAGVGWITAPRDPDRELRDSRRAEMLQTLDWLDTQWLEVSLSAWLAEGDLRATAPEEPRSTSRDATRPSSASEGGPSTPLLPARTRSSPTPNQRRWLERLRELLRSGTAALDQEEVDSKSNALTLYALLAAAEPELAAQPAAASTITLLLACWKAVLECEEPLAAAQEFWLGRPQRVRASLTDAAKEAMDAVAALGDPAADVLFDLLSAAPGPTSLAGRGIETSCAGIFLLLRAVTEARLPDMVMATGAAPLTSILLALGVLWAGASATRDGNTEPGLALWCGLDAPRPAVELLGQLDAPGCEALLGAVVTLMQERSALDPGLVIMSSVPQDWSDSLTEGWPAAIPVSGPLVLVAVHLLRLWARWLPGIAASSAPYLVKNLIRRPGRIDVRDHEMRVTLETAALDVVLEMSGYLREVPAIPWLRHRRVSLEIDRR
jgi:hypothetical protein